MSKIIALNKGEVAIVDDGDFDWLNQWKWHIHRETRWGRYAVRTDSRSGKVVIMHRLIMDAPKGMQVDHINGDGLDNRRENMRLCTNSQNTKNKRLSKSSTSGYKGVSWFSKLGKYASRIRVDGELIRLGYFHDPIEAAKVYDEAAKRYFGEFARLNFPD